MSIGTSENLIAERVLDILRQLISLPVFISFNHSIFTIKKIHIQKQRKVSKKTIRMELKREGLIRLEKNIKIKIQDIHIATKEIVTLILFFLIKSILSDLPSYLQ